MEKVNIWNKMQSIKKTPISDLNDFITCKLCKGYFIDATTIIECLHTFCRSCIVQYLETSKYCPICDVQVNKTKPLHSIRPDKTIQNIVYKLVPRLYQNEVKRKEIFYENHPEAKPTIWEQTTASQFDYILTPEENVYITLRYYGSNEKLRYLRCPSAVTISHISKLIKAKYDLTAQNKIDIFYDQDCLNPAASLMDVSYIYSWKRQEPLDLTYKIYELRAIKHEFNSNETIPNNVLNGSNINSNNWKEVHLKISETGEMHVTDIQDNNLLDLEKPSSENIDKNDDVKETIDKFKLDQITDDKPLISTETNIEKSTTTTTAMTSSESKLNSVETEKKTVKKELPALKYIGKTFGKTNNNGNDSVKLPVENVTKSQNNVSISSLSSLVTVTVTEIQKSTNIISKSSITSISTPQIVSALGKTVSLASTLNLGNNELSVIPISTSATAVAAVGGSGGGVGGGCVTLTPCSTTTVFTTIDKRMCSTKSDDNKLRNEKNDSNNQLEIEENENAQDTTKNLKRKKITMPEASPPSKLPKPTILNHSISWSNLSNPLHNTKHVRTNRNGENSFKSSDYTENLVMNHHHHQHHHPQSATPKSSQETSPIKPIILNRNISHFNLNRPGTPLVAKSQPCYVPKMTYESTNTAGKSNLKNGEKCDGVKSKIEFSNQNINSISKPSMSSSSSSFYQNQHYMPIITPSQLPHNQNLKQLNQEKCELVANSTPSSSLANNCSLLPMASVATPTAFTKTKSNSPIGYKTLRDPPKSWNSQISKANQSSKVQQQQLIGNAQGHQIGDLRNIRPSKFFKGRNMLRYLGNPASGVKPMYQLHANLEKDKNQNQKVEKSEIKKHSIVKIDPKTLKPVSEKAPDISNLSNLSSSNLVSEMNRSTVVTSEMRINSVVNDLKINTSSVSIFSPLKLQSSPKGERRSPKSPHSPKTKVNTNNITTTNPVVNTAMTSLSPKQHRDKTNLTYTPPNPFVPNLSSPTVSPSQFLFPTYDPRFMVAYQSLLYRQQMAAAVAASSGIGSSLSQAFNINMGLSSNSTGIGQHNNLLSALPHCLSTDTPTTTATHIPVKSDTSTTHTVTTTQSSKPSVSINTTSVKKAKDSTTTTPTNKSEKSLVVAVEKLSQNKAKELDRYRQKENEDKKRQSLSPSSGKSPKKIVVSPKSLQIDLHCEVDNNENCKLNEKTVESSSSEGNSNKDDTRTKDEIKTVESTQLPQPTKTESMSNNKPDPCKPDVLPEQSCSETNENSTKTATASEIEIPLSIPEPAAVPLIEQQQPPPPPAAEAAANEAHHSPLSLSDNDQPAKQDNTKNPEEKEEVSIGEVQIEKTALLELHQETESPANQQSNDKENNDSDKSLIIDDSKSVEVTTVDCEQKTETADKLTSVSEKTEENVQCCHTLEKNATVEIVNNDDELNELKTTESNSKSKADDDDHDDDNDVEKKKSVV